MGLSKNLLVCPPNVIAKLSDISLLSVNLSVVVCKYDNKEGVLKYVKNI